MNNTPPATSRTSALSKIRVMLVDDHFVVRAGLVGSLSIEPDIAVVAECSTGEEALDAYRTWKPDITLMDWCLPGMNGVDITMAIRRECADARIIIFSVFDGEEDIFKAASAGVSGYMLKSASRSELLEAIRTVHDGGTAFPEAIAARLKTRQARPDLNEREMAVLLRIVRGRTNKEIGNDLHLAEVTVKFHVGRILEKLGVMDRTQAAMAAVQRGLLRQ